MVGKETFTSDQYSADYDFITQLTFGAIKGGFWVIFDNIQEYPHAILSAMAQQVTKINFLINASRFI